LSSHAYLRDPSPSLTLLRPDPGEAPAIDADTYRSVFRSHAGGVTVVTADAGWGPVGFTATSVVSVSLTPPLISFAVSTSASTFPAVTETERVVVHFLDAAQSELAGRFATSGVDRFGHPTRWSRLPDGSPVLDDPPCYVLGTIEHRFAAGDHQIVVARLRQVEQRRPYRPLVYSGGRYGTTALIT
jgi:flavin reductase (DIM6/NTAB) family NADH-FMN oxidoreductase RutF